MITGGCSHLLHQNISNLASLFQSNHYSFYFQPMWVNHLMRWREKSQRPDPPSNHGNYVLINYVIICIMYLKKHPCLVAMFGKEFQAQFVSKISFLLQKLVPQRKILLHQIIIYHTFSKFLKIIYMLYISCKSCVSKIVNLCLLLCLIIIVIVCIV